MAWSFHRFDNLRSVRGRTDLGDRLEIVKHGGVHSSLNHGRIFAAVADREALRECPRLVVEVPVECGAQRQALRGLQTESVNIGQEYEQSGEPLAALDDPELGGLLDRVDGVAAGVGEPDHLGLGGLCLQQVGREVGRVQGMRDRAQHLAAGRLHDCAVSRSSAWPNA